ncbi:MAG: hypothetical protein ACTSPV_00405 [Candidatus Hodarchaeales archaeon]
MEKIKNDEFEKINGFRKEIMNSDEPRWLKEMRLFGLRLMEHREIIEAHLKEYPESDILRSRLELVVEIENEYFETFDRAIFRERG